MPSRAPRRPAHPLEPLRRVLRVGTIAVVLALPLAGLAGWAADGAAGAAGALLGVLIPAVFFAITVVTALITLRLSPGALGAVVLASWVAKLILLIVALTLIDQWSGWSRPVFGVSFLVAVAGWLGLEAWMVLRTRQPYVTPAPSGTTATQASDSRPSPGVAPGSETGVGKVQASHDRHS